MHILLILVKCFVDCVWLSSLVWILLRSSNYFFNLGIHSLKKGYWYAIVEGLLHNFENLWHLVRLVEDLLIHSVRLG